MCNDHRGLVLDSERLDTRTWGRAETEKHAQCGALGTHEGIMTKGF